MSQTQTQTAVIEDLAKRYIVPQNSREIQRLIDQHEWVKGNMGSLIKAPINANRVERVLDSATAYAITSIDAISGTHANLHTPFQRWLLAC